MKVTTWRMDARVIRPERVSGFYEAPLRESHAFLFRTASLELPPHGGSFSLKAVLEGEEEYCIGPRTVILRPGEFLFLNAGERYASRIRRATRSLAVFFYDGDLARTRRVPAGAGATRDVPQVGFPASPDCWRSAIGLAALLQRRSAAAGPAARSLLACALGELRGLAGTGALARVRKRWTRDELITRILRARAHIDREPGRCTLDELAAIACLSRFHFLRVFREIVGSTPIAYARRRCERAAMTAVRN